MGGNWFAYLSGVPEGFALVLIFVGPEQRLNIIVVGRWVGSRGSGVGEVVLPTVAETGLPSGPRGGQLIAYLSTTENYNY